MLRTHHNVGSAVRLAQSHRYLGYGSLAISIKEFSPMGNYGIVLLTRTREEARHIH